VIFALEDYESLALTVILGELEGGSFNWNALRWEKPD